MTKELPGFKEAVANAVATAKVLRDLRMALQHPLGDSTSAQSALKTLVQRTEALLRLADLDRDALADLLEALADAKGSLIDEQQWIRPTLEKAKRDLAALGVSLED